MSDISDVQQALVTLIAQALYPNGTGQPSVSGQGIVIYSGWPDSSTLDADLVSGKTHVTVFPKQEERNTTRYSKAQQTISTVPATITATVSGQTITFGGTITTPQNIALLVNLKSYVYAVQSSDTLTSIATALATLLAADIGGTTSSGPTITVGTASIKAARVGSVGTVASEVRRQEKVVMISVWANAPGMRDLVGSALDVALAQLEFITMPDGFGARLVYKSTTPVDSLEKSTLYRRDFSYTVEYATTVSSQATAIVVEPINIIGGIDPTAPVIESINL